MKLILKRRKVPGRRTRLRAAAGARAVPRHSPTPRGCVSLTARRIRVARCFIHNQNKANSHDATHDHERRGNELSRRLSLRATRSQTAPQRSPSSPLALSRRDGHRYLPLAVVTRQSSIRPLRPMGPRCVAAARSSEPFERFESEESQAEPEHGRGELTQGEARGA